MQNALTGGSGSRNSVQRKVLLLFCNDPRKSGGISGLLVDETTVDNCKQLVWILSSPSLISRKLSPVSVFVHSPSNWISDLMADDWLERCFETNKRTDEIREDKYTSTFFESSKPVDEIPEDKYSQTFTDSDDFTPVVLKRSKASRPHSTPLTLKWLEENYEIAEGVCIPRSTLYFHYLDYCEKNDTQPVNAASFGKIIRQQFSHITTRRLGTRGQSKYHYYGIGVRESSIYYEIVYSAKSVQSAGDGKKETVKQIVAYSPRSKLGTLLPDFPDVKDIKLPANVEETKVMTFLMMYRAHCQRILDTVIRANFDEVQNFLLHFWQGMPQHIIPILESPTIATVVGVCDSVLYKAISGVLMPTVLQPLPDSLTQVIRRFAKQLDEWLRMALHGLPDKLTQIKFDLARRFSQVLRRQTSLNHLCVAAQSVIHNGEITSQMLEDWMNIDLSSIVKQTLYTMDQYSEKDHFILVNLCKELEQLFEDQAPIESYTAWLDSMVDRCVTSPSSNRPGSLRRLARQFLLMWSCFGTRVIRDMTLYSAPSFGSFHLLHLMFDEYVLYLVEGLHSQERTREFLTNIKDQTEEIILPTPIFAKESLDTKGSLVYNNIAPDCVQRSTVITSSRDASMTESNLPSLCSSRLDDVYSNDSSPSSSVSGYSPGRSPMGPAHGMTLGQTADHRSGQAPQSSCNQRFDNYGYNNYYSGGTVGGEDCQASYTYSLSNSSYANGRQEIPDSNIEWANEMTRYNSTTTNRSRRDVTSTTSSCMSPGVSAGVDCSYATYDYSGYVGQHYTAPAQNEISTDYQGYSQIVDCQLSNLRETGKRKLSVDASQSVSAGPYKHQKVQETCSYVQGAATFT